MFMLALRRTSYSQESNVPRTKDDITQERAMLGLKGAALHLPLLGLTWLFDLLAFHQDNDVFKYLFAIFNIMQALMLLVCYVILNRKVCLGIERV